MGYIMWKEEYNLGFEEIDKQHYKWSKLINKMYEFRSEAYTTEKLQSLISEIIEFSKTHFQHEETLLKAYDCQDIEEMARAHSIFIAQVINWKNEFQKYGDSGDFSEFLKFLRDFFINHTQAMDRKYFQIITKIRS